jgi:hypothetical protein
MRAKLSSCYLPKTFLSLALFVVGILAADYTDDAMPFNNLAMLTSLLDR